MAPFRLLDQHGAPFDLGGAGGGPTIVTFFYTGCTESCPLLAAQLLALHAEMRAPERDRVQFLFITVDPGRDRPPALVDYARRLGLPSPGFVLLTGSHADIVGVGKQFQLVFRQERGERIDHSAVVYLLDADRAVRGVYPIARLSRPALLHDLAYLLGSHR